MTQHAKVRRTELYYNNILKTRTGLSCGLDIELLELILVPNLEKTKHDTTYVALASVHISQATFATKKLWVETACHPSTFDETHFVIHVVQLCAQCLRSCQQSPLEVSFECVLAAYDSKMSNINSNNRMSLSHLSWWLFQPVQFSSASGCSA